MFQDLRSKHWEKGQSLIEIIIGLTVGVLIVGGVTTLIGLNLRSSYDTRTVQAAASLAQELVEQAKSVSESSWHNVYNLTKGTGQRYYISSTTLSVSNGIETVVADGKNFTRYFYIENVNRTNCGVGDITTDSPASCDNNFPYSGIADDPLTQKITVVVSSDSGEVLRQVQYLIRARNSSYVQTDWSGGSGQLGPITSVNDKFDSSVDIDSTSTLGSIKVLLPGGGGGGYGGIDATSAYAWNDIIGWVDFKSTGNVKIYNDRLEGYASSAVGFIALNCNSTPSGNVCASSNFKVSNDGNGALTGWAWNDGIGWVSFDSTSAGSSYPYQVTIDTDTGDFHGWAWNDVIGWISFNCAEAGSCAYPYKVKTDWTNYGITGTLYSSIFDTGLSQGAALNSIIWHGSQPSGTSVNFQIASSNNSNGPWSYLGPNGTGGTFYSGNSNTSIPINIRYHNNVRYLRYKILLGSDSSKSLTPQVDDVIINYSL